MKKVLYIAQAEFCEQSDGVVKKIKGQIDALKRIGDDVFCIGYFDGRVGVSDCEDLENMPFELLEKYQGRIKRVDFWMNTRDHVLGNKYDTIYIRYSYIDFLVLDSLRRFHRNNTKIIMEVPSVKQGLSVKSGVVFVQYCLDRFLRRWCGRYVDKVLYVGDQEVSFLGKVAEPIPNGIPYGGDRIKKTGTSRFNDSICMVGVSTMGVSRGFDRLILGLNDYYKGTEHDICLTLKLVGEGESVEGLKKLVKDFDLDDKVLFYPKLAGDELDRVFEEATIGVGALGLYSIGAEVASTLKVKEYFLRGLPFIYAGTEIGVPVDYIYSMRFDNVPGAIDCMKIIDFVNGFDHKAKETIINDMRQFAYERFSWQNILLDSCGEYFT